MLCSNCNGTISQSDKFCRHCGQKVVVSPPMPPPLLRPHRDGIRYPIELNDFGPAEILAAHESLLWGAHLYTGASQDPSEVKTRPEGCPEWVTKSDWLSWFRRGLTIWDHAAQQIGTLLAAEALDLLKSLESGDDWKTHGIPIIERHRNRLILDDPPRPKRSKKKGRPEPEPPPDNLKERPKYYEQERVRLTGDAAEEFLIYLRDNEGQLRHMADQEAVLQEKADEYLFHIQMQFMRDLELSQFDGTQRKFHWELQEYPRRLVCDAPPDRGTITLSKDSIWWIPVIERPGHHKIDYEQFVRLEEAVAWVEQKIPELRTQDEEFEKTWERERAEEEAQFAALPRMDLTPYWIDPANLEPERRTYRALIQVEYVPYRGKTREISFGQQEAYDEEYYTPSMLADQLKINPAQVDVKMPIEGLGWYYLRSAATYLQESVAGAATQKLWDQSLVLDKFWEKKVLRARYGYEEVETGYHTWLGVCESQANPWPKSNSRAEHMADLAMRETLLRALDVNGWRAFLKLVFKDYTDEDLLQRMHELRAKSRYQSVAVRAESLEWLAVHGSPKKQGQRTKLTRK